MNQHKAKDEREQLRRAVVEEALQRVSNFEEQIAQHRKTTNQVGRALEALANVITAMRRENVERDAKIARLEEFINRSWYFRILCWFRRPAARGAGASMITFPAPAAGGSVSIRKVEDVEAPAAGDASAPRPACLHQYVKDGLSYRCMVEGCGRVASLDEIAGESDYLRELADPKA